MQLSCNNQSTYHCRFGPCAGQDYNRFFVAIQLQLVATQAGRPGDTRRHWAQ